MPFSRSNGLALCDPPCQENRNGVLPMPADIIQVVTTTAEKESAEKIGTKLLERRLAACVQISGPVESSYWWNGRIETAREYLCTIKTLRDRFAAVEKI